MENLRSDPLEYDYIAPASPQFDSALVADTFHVEYPGLLNVSPSCRHAITVTDASLDATKSDPHVDTVKSQTWSASTRTEVKNRRSEKTMLRVSKGVSAMWRQKIKRSPMSSPKPSRTWSHQCEETLESRYVMRSF